MRSESFFFFKKTFLFLFILPKMIIFATDNLLNRIKEVFLFILTNLFLLTKFAKKLVFFLVKQKQQLEVEH